MTLARFDARVLCAHCLRFPFILPKDNLSLARSDARSRLSRVQCVRTLNFFRASVCVSVCVCVCVCARARSDEVTLGQLGS